MYLLAILKPHPVRYRIRAATSVLPGKEGQQVDFIYPLGTDEDRPEEVVLNVQGYLVQARLPPILRREQYVSFLPTVTSHID